MQQRSKIETKNGEGKEGSQPPWPQWDETQNGPDGGTRNGTLTTWPGS